MKFLCPLVTVGIGAEKLTKQGRAWLGAAWQGKARRGKARQGKHEVFMPIGNSGHRS